MSVKTKIIVSQNFDIIVVFLFCSSYCRLLCVIFGLSFELYETVMSNVLWHSITQIFILILWIGITFSNILLMYFDVLWYWYTRSMYVQYQTNLFFPWISPTVLHEFLIIVKLQHRLFVSYSDYELAIQFRFPLTSLRFRTHILAGSSSFLWDRYREVSSIFRSFLWIWLLLSISLLEVLQSDVALIWRFQFLRFRFI
jgi:hypothetical protein